MKRTWGIVNCSYLYPAHEVGPDGRAEAPFLPAVSLECSRLFLEQIAANNPQAEPIVIWDLAGFHQTTGPTAVPRILSLPPHSPELNAVEKLGVSMKGAMGNAFLPTLRQLEDKI